MGCLSPGFDIVNQIISAPAPIYLRISYFNSTDLRALLRKSAATAVAAPQACVPFVCMGWCFYCVLNLPSLGYMISHAISPNVRLSPIFEAVRYDYSAISVQGQTVAGFLEFLH